MNKRTFLKQFATLGIGSPLLFQNLDRWISTVEHLSPAEVAKDEDFWAKIRSGYRLKPDYINLENGYYCFMPQETMENFIHHVREINYHGSYYLRTVQWDNKQFMTEKLAELAGCPADELAITRNTTESLDLIIGGIHWQAGDEAVMAEQDYGAMLDMFELQAQRHGVVNRRVSLPNHPRSDSEIVELYEKAITPKTRLLMVCQMVNITGQVLPVRAIAEMAHGHGVEVIADSAHALGQLDFKISKLGCDYFGSSLHKWLGAPLGTGMMYIRQDKIEKVWPLLGDDTYADDDIRKFEHLGTRPCGINLSILDALEFQQSVGIKKKQARLRYLKDYWTQQLKGVPGVVVNTPWEMERSSAIANVGLKKMSPAELADKLFRDFNIFTVAIDTEGVKGIRVTPQVFTSTDELNQLVNALKTMAAA